MTLTQMRSFLRRNRIKFAFAALVVFAALVLGVIYYIRQAQKPLAPTAPESKPSAAQDVCTTDFTVPMQCLDLTVEGTLQQGEEVSFTCSALAGVDQITFEYRTSPDGQWQTLDSASITESTTLTVGDYLETRCTPCAGDYCASAANVAEDCSLSYEAPEEEEVACLDLTVSPDLEEGETVSFSCLAQNAETYLFEYQESASGSYQQLGDVTASSSSAQLTVGEYLAARCTPCAGDQCASATEVEQNCSLAYEAPPAELACLDITASEILDKGDEVTFTCAPVDEADSYRFEYRSADSGSYSLLSEGSSNVSDSLTIGEYLDVRCTPCRDGECAAYIEACLMSYEYQVAPQCDSQCVNNADCPADYICADNGRCRNAECVDEADCVCDEEESEEAGFVIEKYHDQDGDGSRDSGEPGLDWSFEWDRNGDESWRDYVTYANSNGRGGNVDNLEPGDVIRIKEMSKSGWEATTNTSKTLTLQEGKRMLAQFGNWQPSSTPTPTSTPTPSGTPIAYVSPTPTPSVLPEAGSSAQTYGLAGAGMSVVAFGLYRWYLKRMS